MRKTAPMLTALCCLVVSIAAAEDKPTLYDKLGGDPGITRIVDDFVTLILNDERINFAFAGGDMSIFKQRLGQQFCALADGPCEYTGKNMRVAHEKLAVTPAQFNALAEDLYDAMKQSHVPYRVQNQLMALLAPMEPDVVRPGIHLDRTPSDNDLLKPAEGEEQAPLHPAPQASTPHN